MLELLGINTVKISNNNRYGKTNAPLLSRRHRYTESDSDYEEEEWEKKKWEKIIINNCYTNFIWRDIYMHVALFALYVYCFYFSF
jgi:hypothetical protein